jgi:hypothetical protein
MGSSFEFLVAGLPEQVRRLEEKGRFKDAVCLIDKILAKNESLPSALKSRLEWEPERIKRMQKGYALSWKEAFGSLRNRIPDLTQKEFERWVENGFMDCREIEDEVKFFNNFIPNLLRDNEEIRKRVKQPAKTFEEIKNLARKQIDAVVEKRKTSESRYVEPVRNRVLMQIKTKPEVAPEGEIIKVWLPFPRKDPLQPEIKLISATPKKYILATEDSNQRTVYFENKAVEGKELEFKIEYEYVVYASCQEVNPAKTRPYSRNEFYQRYTSEQLPHMAFTPYLRKLTEEIISEETNPYLKARRIYRWITENVSYALVPEYSTINCISEYAARNLKGDCGVQALLFITLCRISSVPARWQSGWYLNPIKPGPHDWAQFYIEPYGWLYADLSMGGHQKSIEKYHRFYFGNVDHFRLIANADISSEFTPPKNHHRSDTVDNQRGEVEWKGGNLYYDTWSYSLKLVAHQSFR